MWKSCVSSFALSLSVIAGTGAFGQTAPDAPDRGKQEPSPGSGTTTDEKTPEWFTGAVRGGEPGVTPPVILKRITPDYPPSALAANVTGDVELDARVETDGRVSHVRIVRSVLPLDASAEKAAKKFEFQPAKKDGQAVPAIVRIAFGFSLPKTPGP
jgi:TonB family protein